MSNCRYCQRRLEKPDPRVGGDTIGDRPMISCNHPPTSTPSLSSSLSPSASLSSSPSPSPSLLSSSSWSAYQRLSGDNQLSASKTNRKKFRLRRVKHFQLKICGCLHGESTWKSLLIFMELVLLLYHILIGGPYYDHKITIRWESFKGSFDLINSNCCIEKFKFYLPTNLGR